MWGVGLSIFLPSLPHVEAGEHLGNREQCEQKTRLSGLRRRACCGCHAAMRPSRPHVPVRGRGHAFCEIDCERNYRVVGAGLLQVQADEVSQRQRHRTALNAVRHSLSHAAQTGGTDPSFFHSFQMGHGDLANVPEVASRPGTIPLPSALTLPSRIILPILTQPSNKNRALQCGIPSDRFLPTLPAISFGRGAAWRTPTWHTS